MKTVAIIQARMNSTRLPGKVLIDIVGKPMLWHVVRRTQRAQTLDQVVVAMPDQPADTAIAEYCAEVGIDWFRGNEEDVLDRYYQAASHFEADVVVRITADCPLIDPEVIDKVVNTYRHGRYDYVTNTIPCTYPDGLDVEVFPSTVLGNAWRYARWESEREHVTPYIRNHPELFQIKNVAHEEDLSNMRWTVDEPQDLEFMRAVYNRLENSSLGMADVLAVLERCPALLEISAGIGRNEGYQKSLREDQLVDLDPISSSLDERAYGTDRSRTL